MAKKTGILICGGGNGAHCFTALASVRENLRVSVLTLFEDEAERWNRAMKEGLLTVSVSQKDGTLKEIHSAPYLITKNPKAALEGVQIIFIVVPAYAHENFFRALFPHIRPNTLIVGLPGHAGFELQCKHFLNVKAKTCSIMGFESLPWACRIVEFGRKVQLLGYKDVLRTSFLTGTDCHFYFPAFETLQNILGDRPRIQIVDNILSMILIAGSIIHPPVMYGKWKNWDGKALIEKPLFYQGVDDFQAHISSKLSDELISTAKKISELRNDLNMSDVIHIFDWFKSHYSSDITDCSSLKMAMKTNKAYAGLVHPMKATFNGFVPDFEYRYITEDIPFGLVVMKGLAEIVGEKTPTLDEIILWAQKKLEKEYVKGSRLVGKDIKDVRAPQSFGLNTLDQLLQFIKLDMK